MDIIDDGTDGLGNDIDNDLLLLLTRLSINDKTLIKFQTFISGVALVNVNFVPWAIQSELFYKLMHYMVEKTKMTTNSYSWIDKETDINFLYATLKAYRHKAATIKKIDPNSAELEYINKQMVKIDDRIDLLEKIEDFKSSI